MTDVFIGRHDDWEYRIKTITNPETQVTIQRVEIHSPDKDIILRKSMDFVKSEEVIVEYCKWWIDQQTMKKPCGRPNIVDWYRQ
jgi:hypothetical protein